MTDQQLDDLFRESDAFEAFEDKMSGSAMSAGSSFRADNYDVQYQRAYSRWLVTKMPPDIGASPPELTIDFSPTVTDDARELTNAQFDKIPAHVKQLLAERGYKINVGNRADDTAAWPAFATAAKYTSDTKIKDGRKIGTLSFHDFVAKQTFISTGTKGGSRNTVAHEAGHGIDDLWLEEGLELTWPDENGVNQTFTVGRISRDDPEWKWIHDNYTKDEEGIDQYYRGGANGTDAGGREEFWAEGLAAYLHGSGRNGLVGYPTSKTYKGFLGNIPDREEDIIIDEEDGVTVLNPGVTKNLVADYMIGVWRRYGIITRTGDGW